MSVRVTKDRRLISRILNHPKVFSTMLDDSAPKPVDIVDGLYLTNEDGTGIVRIDPMTHTACIVHIAALPELWGKVRDFSVQAILWGMVNTAYTKVVSIIPEYNRLAISLCLKIGFTHEGRITKSFLKGWRFYDQVVLGLTKREFIEGVLKWQ